ncbi:MAG: metallophosphoesterase family protein [Sphingomonadales bacterium]
MLGLRSRKSKQPQRALPEGERVYAIGDIHGRSDCFDALMTKIDADDAERGPAKTTIVLLGDLVDRGPDSRGVVERADAMRTEYRCVFLMGNHEEIFIKAWEGDMTSARMFHRIGGRETLLSYGVTEDEYDSADFDKMIEMLRTHVPAEHIAFLRRFRDTYAAGDYLFVHAGIRPGTPIDEQDATDMRWIRDKFLDDARDHGAMIVHGHSITPGVDEQANRIGIDTGAYASGRLTALGVEGTERWTLSS